MRSMLLVVLAVGCSSAQFLPGASLEVGADGSPDTSSEAAADSAADALVEDADAFADVAETSETGTDAVVDPNDEDGDGFTKDVDCNDKNPLVNPGAFDFPGDGVDDDCTGTADDAGACDSGTPTFPHALGLCRETTAGASGKARTWGVISGSIETIDGFGKPLDMQSRVWTSFGSVVMPTDGAYLALLSTGSTRFPSESGYLDPLSGTAASGNEGTLPAGWPRNAASCATPVAKTGNDSVVLHLTLRVPTNAQSFSLDSNLFVSEYSDYVCSTFNDGFAMFVTSKKPLDSKFAGSIYVNAKGDPITVNEPGLFTVCSPKTTAKFTYTCPKGRAELAGTGYTDGSADLQHASTSWLRTTAGVVPGEDLDIRIAIWNTGDHLLQSTMLLDRWKWLKTAKASPDTVHAP